MSRVLREEDGNPPSPAQHPCRRFWRCCPRRRARFSVSSRPGCVVRLAEPVHRRRRWPSHTRLPPGRRCLSRGTEHTQQNRPARAPHTPAPQQNRPELCQSTVNRKHQPEIVPSTCRTGNREDNLVVSLQNKTYPSCMIKQILPFTDDHAGHMPV